MFHRNKKLAEIRSKWEDNLTIVAEHFPMGDTILLVVLQDKEKTYYLHRYCPFDQHWDVSIDARTTDLSKVLKWAMSGGDPSILEKKDGQ